MASNTNNLGLLKKDPVADGNDTFNVRTMLNENWDKIDEFAGKTTPISKGGTGATTAAQALSNLGAAAVSDVGNLHVWERVQTYSEPVPEVPAGYTLGEVEENVAVTGISSSQVGLYVGDSISVDSDGNVTINNEQYHFNDPSGAINGWYGSSYSTLLAGKFCRVENSTRYTTLVSGVFYVPVGTTLVNPNNNTLTIPSLQRVTGYPYTPAIPAGTTTDYLTSTDRDAYPDQSAEGASYHLGGAESKQVSEYYDTGTTRYLNLSYSDSVVVSDDGSSVELNNPTTVQIGANAKANFDVAKGKFCKFSQTSDTSVIISISDLVFIPSDAEFTLTYPNSRYTVTCSKVQSVIAIPANTTITYLGQLGGGARIETGSYVGTGTYGSGNKNTLTFENKNPKKVTIVPKTHSNNSQIVSGSFPFVNGAESAVARLYLGSYSSKNVNLSWSDDSVSWYSTDSADVQLNKNSETYFYVAEF